MTFRSRSMTVVVALALLVAACGSSDGDDAADGDDVATPAGSGDECTADTAGGAISIGTLSEPGAIDPNVALTGPIGGMETLAVYDTLLRYDRDAEEYVANVAEAVEVNDDFSEWTITLRSGLEFSNGDVLDADAVKASIERLRREDNRTVTRADVESTIAEVVVEDPLTARFVLTGPRPNFGFLLASSTGMIVNVPVADEAGDAFGVSATPGAGIGPYELVRFTPGEEIVLQAKDDYWGGPVCIEELRFVATNGSTAAYEAFQSGDIQAAYLTDAETVAQAFDDGIEQSTYRLGLGEMLLLNHGLGDSNPPTADIRVRQAIAAAVDPDAINERVFSSTAIATSALFSDETDIGRDLVGPEFDPERARELVAEVLADTDWDGSLDFACGDAPASAVELCISIEGMLEAVGFDVTITNRPTSNHAQQIIVAQDFDIANWANTTDAADPWRALSRFESDGSANRNGTASPELDSALSDLRAAVTAEEVNDAMVVIQEVWNETVPTVNFREIQEIIIWSSDISGVVPTADRMVSFASAFLDG